MEFSPSPPCISFLLALGRILNSLVSQQKVAQTVKRLPTMRETGVRSLGREDPLEKEMATLSSILARKNPCTEEPDKLQSTGSQKRRARLCD